MGLSVCKRNKEDVGSCNFCNDQSHETVFVVEGEAVIVRICRDCMSRLIIRVAVEDLGI